MLLSIEKSQQSKSLDKVDFVPGELITLHFQPAPGEPWESYAMSPAFLHKVMSHYRDQAEADIAISEIRFQPINGHSYLGVDETNPDEL